MPRPLPALDEAFLPGPGRPLNRSRIKAILESHQSPRLDMTIILAASGLGAMLASWILLQFGVDSMTVRYPIAVAVAYGTFLVSVWTWLRVNGFVDNSGRARRGARRFDEVLDLPIPSGSSITRVASPVPRGGGGTFDGGGASASFEAPRAVAVASLDQGSEGGEVAKEAAGALSGLDGDGLALLVLALLLVLSIFFTSGYLVWFAPDILAEAAFGALLAAGLARPTARETATGWMMGVARKTWWPFTIVMILALVFAAYAEAHFPEATTFRQAIALAVK